MFDDTDAWYNRVRLRINLSLGAIWLASVVALIVVSFWLISAANTTATRDSLALVKTALDGEKARVAGAVRDYADWDQAFDWISDRDTIQITDSIGSGATDSATFDLLLIADAGGDLLYAFETDGDGSDLAPFDTLELRPIADALAASDDGPTAEMIGLLEHDGRMFLVSATRVRPHSRDLDPGQSQPVLIAGLASDDAWLSTTASQLLLQDMELIWSDVPLDDLGPMTSSLRILVPDILGQPRGLLRWTPPRPGAEMLRRIGPFIVGIALMLTALCAFIERAAASQARHLMAERHRSRTDALTGLMNREGMRVALDHPDIIAAFAAGQVALLYLDVNNFKELNDSAGHEAGDEALLIVSARIRRCLRQDDIGARVGGDEFICVLSHEDPMAAAQSLAARIHTSLSDPVEVGHAQHEVDIAIGIGVSAPGDTWSDLIRRADRAMYVAKTNGTGTEAIAERDMDDARLTRREMQVGPARPAM